MRAEDEAEFREYVAGRWKWLVQAAVLLTGDPWHAEDLAQTALVRVFGSWSRVRAADDMDAYTMRILINQNKNCFRRRRVAEDLTAAPPERGGGDPTSRILGCSVGTVKSQASKGLAKLRMHASVLASR